MTCEELSSLVMQNRDSIAFLVGNGIHNYEQYEKHVLGKVNWEKLIIKVRDELFPDKKGCCLDSTLSLPKQFDSIIWEKGNADLEYKLKIPNNYLIISNEVIDYPFHLFGHNTPTYILQQFCSFQTGIVILLNVLLHNFLPRL